MPSPSRVDDAGRMQYEKVWSANSNDVRPLVVEVGGKFVLVPTSAPDGTPLSDSQALDMFSRTQRMLGAFDSAQEAEMAAGALLGLLR